MKEQELRKLRLYMLRWASGKLYKSNEMSSVLSGPVALYFSNKEKAKRKRDELNAAGAAEKIVVSIGPDHKRFRSGTTA